MFRHTRKFIALLINAMLLIPVLCNAQTVNPFVLAYDTWEQLSIPANPGELTIEQLFGDDLPAQEYNNSWIVFTYDASTLQYVDPGIDGVLIQGTGFWIIQLTQQDVELDIPSGLPEATVFIGAGCSSTNGCSEGALATRFDDATWTMLGAPFSASVSSSEINFLTRTPATACFQGCSLEEASNQGLTGNLLWHYNSSAGSYTNLANQNLSPWQAVWVATTAAAVGTNPFLIIPDPLTASCDTAIALLELDQQGNVSITGTLNPASDNDYYSVEVTAGEWLRMFVQDDSLTGRSTTLTLFDDSGLTQLAQTQVSDENTTISHRFVDGGTYCLRVTNTHDPSNSELGYFINAAQLQELPDGAGVYFDVEPNNDTEQAQFLPLPGDISVQQLSIYGLLNDQSDKDVFNLSASDSSVAETIFISPVVGINSDGSTQQPGIINILDSDGTTILAQLDMGQGANQFFVPMDALNSYFIEVNSPDTADLGANPFYEIISTENTELNQQELFDDENDDWQSPETALPTISGDLVSHFVGGYLTGKEDTDWWTFNADMGDSVIVACTSHRSGSAVRFASVSLFQDPTALPLESDVESATNDLLWANLPDATRNPVTIAAGGPHYLKISANQFNNTIANRHYRCGILVI